MTHLKLIHKYIMDVVLYIESEANFTFEALAYKKIKNYIENDEWNFKMQKPILIRMTIKT